LHDALPISFRASVSMKLKNELTSRLHRLKRDTMETPPLRTLGILTVSAVSRPAMDPLLKLVTCTGRARNRPVALVELSSKTLKLRLIDRPGTSIGGAKPKARPSVARKPFSLG